MYIVPVYTRVGNIFLPASREFLCPECQKGLLIFRDFCNRIVRYENGSHEWIKIPRHKCSNPKCSRLHRMLPDMLLPHKHYPEETISGVLDGIVGPDDADSENSPSEKTMLRWKHWLMFNQMNIEGQMKSIGCRILGFNEELLASSASLLCQIRTSIPDAWLRIIIRYIYNSGNTLQAFC